MAAVRRNGVRSVDDLLILKRAVADGFVAPEADVAPIIGTVVPGSPGDPSFTGAS